MGRPPISSTAGTAAAAPMFRFLPSEVADMEACRRQLSDGVVIPSHAVLQTLADNFSASPQRAAGKVVIQPRQVWKWFQNRRYSLPHNIRRAAHHGPSSSSSSSSSGRKSLQGLQHEFEDKSAHDGAWYDVAAFLSLRWLESGDLEVMVRFSGFGAEDDEWVNVRKCVRQCSLTCAPTECVAVVPGDLILCFQEGKEHALYFDAHVLDIQRRRHDSRGCRCRFLVRYDHDSSEEIVPLTKVCRRPETDYWLSILHVGRVAATTGVHTPSKEVIVDLTSNNKSPAKHKPKKQHKLMDVKTDEGTMVSSLQQEGTPDKVVCPLLSATSEAHNSSSDATTKEVEASMVVEDDDEVQVVAKMEEV